MILPNAPSAYSIGDQGRMRDALRRADEANLKKGRDIELTNGARVILTAPDGGQWALAVSNAGSISATAV